MLYHDHPGFIRSRSTNIIRDLRLCAGPVTVGSLTFKQSELLVLLRRDTFIAGCWQSDFDKDPQSAQIVLYVPSFDDDPARTMVAITAHTDNGHEVFQAKFALDNLGRLLINETVPATFTDLVAVARQASLAAHA